MGNMSYKYGNATVNIQENNGDSCFIDYIEKEIEAYRWVFHNINDPKNFIPLAKDPQCSSARRKCGGWALSFHITEDASIEMWQKLNDLKPNHYKKIGTHIAKGQVTKSDGKCSETDEQSHFNLIEYENVDLQTKFKIIKQIVSDEIMDTL
jgi:hypothetical protein